MEPNAIEVDSLRKSFGDVQALQEVSLVVGAGEVYGLMGPQGAGKSTLIHILMGLVRLSAGWVEVLGTPDLEHARQRIGFLPERARYHARYSAREYLRFLGAFDGMGGATLDDRVVRVLQRVGLEDAADQQIAAFSRGMLQRLGMAQALLNDPELLLLDEPFSGLDPAAQSEMLTLIHDLRADRRTIVITTPYFPDLEQVCDRVGVLVQGRLVAQADARQLRQPPTSIRITLDRLSPTLAQQLRQVGSAVICGERDVTLRPNSPRLQSQVMRLILDADAVVTSLVPQERPLEHLYIQALHGEPTDRPVAEDDLAEPVANPVADAASSPESTEVWAAPVPREAPPSPPLPPAPAAPRQDVQRSGEGDTLLRELLRRDRNRDDDA